jgi:hypothetical protein
MARPRRIIKSKGTFKYHNEEYTMRTLLFVAALLLMIGAVTANAQTGEKAWFDTTNCAFCKEIAAQPGLTAHMHHEYHNVSNGMLHVAYIDKDFVDEYQAAQEGMKKVIADLQTGKQVPMCGHCETIGTFYMKGVKMEVIHSAEAEMVLYTATEPAVVKAVQDFGARSATEMAKVNAAKKN